MNERPSLTTAGRSLPHESRSSDVTQFVAPPPYESDPNSSVFLAETTTTRTEVVTTTTTTHFLSLSSWRKRSFANLMHQNADLNGNSRRAPTEPSARPTTLLVEKELPPTPPHEQDFDSNISDVSFVPSPSGAYAGGGLSGELASASLSAGSFDFPNTDARPGMHSTTVLARATLGLGLPHVLPLASLPSPGTDASFCQARYSAERDTTATEIHRTDKVVANSTRGRPPPIDLSLEEDRRRRTRNLSFGTSSFLKFGPVDVKGKRKENETDDESPAKGSPKTIPRRPSFWSRKKSETVVLSPTTFDNTTGQFAPHLTLPPISPFDTNITITPSSSPPRRQRTLSRSYSERGDLHQTTEVIPSRRPATANPSPGLHMSRFPIIEPREAKALTVFMRSSCRPQTSVPSQRPRSFTTPPVLSSSSLDNPVSPTTPLPCGPSASSPETRRRPRSTTSSRYSLDRGLKAFSSSDTHVSRKSQIFASPKAQWNPPLPLGDQESPELYLSRLQAAVSKAEIAGILASNADSFHVQALRTYFKQFDFVDDPLDVALRRLLMEVGLPRETQQIDRVVEAFAGRYVQCNPTLFTSEDHPYILAFSLIMLHTDAFNKSNKRKMTRAAYVRNARLPGVASEVLDCYYDNIVFAPFIFIEDPVDINGQRGVSSETMSSRPSARSAQSGTATLMRGNKIDPYYLIANNLLGPLRLRVDDYVPMENPYSYEGTAGPWDEAQLRLAFAKAGEMEVGSADHGLVSPFFGLGMGGSPLSSLGNIGASVPSSSEVWTLKVTKVGLLNRKDDILEGGKKALNRKWKFWGVVLTGSQLLFFRDTSWSTSMLAQTVPSDGHVIFPQQAVLRPDEVLSVKDAVAVIDKSYIKHEHTLRFVLAGGRQILLQAPEENELNEWIARINYASAFKTAGVRMRPLDMSGIDVKLTGIAAAASHLRDLQHHGQLKAHSPIPEHMVNMASESESKEQGSASESNPTVLNGLENMNINVPVVPEIEGASQFKATFDQVKVDLAAVGCRSPPNGEAFPSSPGSKNRVQSEDPHLPSRSEIMQVKIQDLDSRIAASHAHLDADMRFVWNVATLTPFQKSTRDRLVVALHGVSKRVMQVRLDLTKFTCHRHVLLNDLASERGAWHRTKTIALQAAQETLQNHRLGNTPRLTYSPLSYHETLGMDISAARRSSQHLDTPLSCRPESSHCDSFHSAMDFGPAWASAEDVVSSELLATPPLFDSPKLSSSLSLPRFDTKSATSSPSGHSLTLHSANRSPRTSGESDKPEEQAEAWNQTRCAQRVSLVRLPSYIQMPIGKKT